MTRHRWLAGAASFVLVLAACGGDEPGDGRAAVIDQKPALQPDGPLRGLGLVADVSKDGTFTDPQLAFTTDDTEATAIVTLGDDVPEDATLTVDWYRLVGVDGREHLFSHQIRVGPTGYAFSQGVASGGLAPGLYETVATLGDRLVRTPWVVRIVSQAGGALPNGGGGLALLSLNSLAQVGDEDWNVPDSGDSGWYEPEGPTEEPPPPGPCEVTRIITTLSPLTEMLAFAYWNGSCTTMTVTATVSGPPQTLATKTGITPEDLSFLVGNGDLCELPGGSDLPGTVVHVTATGDGDASGSESEPLPDHGLALIGAAESRPAAGSVVDAGDKIDFHAIGMVMPPALGIEKLDLYVGGELLDSVGNTSGSSQPQPCDLGRLYADLVAIDKYTVPDDPPPIIEACAEVTGFDGNKNRDCIEFYSGEVWKGTVDSTITTVPAAGEGLCPNPTFTNGTATFVVASDGSVAGTYDVDGCGVSQPHAEFTGTVTDAGFLFPELIVFTNGELIPKVSPTEAKATLKNFQGTPGVGGAQWVTTWNMTCVTCGD